MIPACDAVPLKRPHYHIHDGQLFFMISSRPFANFSSQDLELWETIDGCKNIGELEKIFPGCFERLQRFWTLGICEFVPENFPAPRRRVLIIEPHMDDAVLSVGGLMWKKQNECDFSVVSVVGISNFTSYHRQQRLTRDYYDVETITSLRRKESETVMRLVGGTHHMLDKYDSPLRYNNAGNWSVDWHQKHVRALSAFQNQSPVEEEVEAWSYSIVEVLDTIPTDEIWIPMGVGTSTDHETTRNACLRALMRFPKFVQQAEIYFYQDSPYGASFAGHTAQIVTAFTSAGGELERICVDVTDSMEWKIRLISIFGSQFKLSYMQPKVEACAHKALESEKLYGELRYRIIKFPKVLNEISMYSGINYIYKTISRLKDWYPKHRNAKLIRIICPMGVGRWRDYMEYLLTAFPSAIFEVHKSFDSIAETKGLKSDRIKILAVNGNSKEWVKHLVKVFISSPHPTIFLTHSKHEALSPIIKHIFFLTNPLLCTTMDHLVLALRNYKE